MPIGCCWMGLELSSPFLLASLTLFSHTELNRHAEYLAKCVQMGAGAVILPSVNPARPSASENWNRVKVRTAVVPSGLGQPMGFALLGPTNPNIIPVSYGAALAEALAQRSLGVPVIGSIVNLGTLEEFTAALTQLTQSPVNGIELNFSCPNILTKNSDGQFGYEQLILKAREICGTLPISLKLPPTVSPEGVDRSALTQLQGLTLTNAHIGLLPPNPKTPELSPFAGCEHWAPSGIYGPQERLLTYHTLYQAHRLTAELGLDISCVGGIVNAEHAIQALLLGASTVQLSSAIAWNGILSFRHFNEALEQHLVKQNIPRVEELRGRALSHIVENADLAAADFDSTEKRHITESCRSCEQCSCTDRLCIAISQPKPHSRPQIDETLCSGCGWCEAVCSYHAIAR